MHARTREELYGGEPHREAFARAREALSVPLCYNGNLFTVKDVRDLAKGEPETESVMLGRFAEARPVRGRSCAPSTGSCMTGTPQSTAA